ncbi:helix-turn-helix transcriptional regulator [Nocardia sp. NPDC046763]|uniref:PadR family transcriptional regulator n=1 Tax=Nocardia sp. NPDC046763 TaxID=3155256 RepID=UPI0033C17E56
MAIGNPLGSVVLGLLLTRPMHPYEILQMLRRGCTVGVSAGSLYNVVAALERRKFVEATGSERSGRRPPRTVYRITAAGTTEFHAHLEHMLCTPEKIGDQWRLSLASIRWLPPDRATELLRTRQRRLRQRIADLGTMIQNLSDGDLPASLTVEIEYERHMADAELRFVADLADRLVSADTERGRDVEGEQVGPDRLAEAIPDPLTGSQRKRPT